VKHQINTYPIKSQTVEGQIANKIELTSMEEIANTSLDLQPYDER